MSETDTDRASTPNAPTLQSGGRGGGSTSAAVAPSVSPPTRRAAREALRKHRSRRTLRIIALGVAFLLVLGVSAVFVVYRKLDGNITSENILSKLGADRPAAAKAAKGEQRPLNVLLIGSDSRAGANASIGGLDEGQRSDTTILLHLSGDRKRATAVSIPRDSMVQMPSCVLPDGKTSAPGLAQFNSAYSLGGSACTIRTVEHLTGIRIDHHVVVDFTGFKKMVDALGGVPVCLPKAVKDKQSHLDLPAGRQVVRGDQALAFVRVRHKIDQFGDLGRIKRQQVFLAAMVQKATSAGVLANPVKLYSFLDAATKSVTTDPGLASLNEMRKLAQSLQGIGLGNVAFLTVPVTDYRPDPNRVVWIPEQAAPIWEALRTDTPLPGEKPVPGATATPSPSPSPTGSPLTVAPQQIRVRVLNGSGVNGAATRAATDLRDLGFAVLGTGNADSNSYTQPVVRYGPSRADSARTVAAAIPGARAELVPSLQGTVEVVVGSDYRGVQAVTVVGAPKAPRKPTPTTTVQARTADQDICS